MGPDGNDGLCRFNIFSSALFFLRSRARIFFLFGDRACPTGRWGVGSNPCQISTVRVKVAARAPSSSSASGM